MSSFDFPVFNKYISREASDNFSYTNYGKKIVLNFIASSNYKEAFLEALQNEESDFDSTALHENLHEFLSDSIHFGLDEASEVMAQLNFDDIEDDQGLWEQHSPEDALVIQARESFKNFLFSEMRSHWEGLIDDMGDIKEGCYLAAENVEAAVNGLAVEMEDDSKPEDFRNRAKIQHDLHATQLAFYRSEMDLDVYASTLAYQTVIKCDAHDIRKENLVEPGSIQEAAMIASFLLQAKKEPFRSGMLGTSYIDTRSNARPATRSFILNDKAYSEGLGHYPNPEVGTPEEYFKLCAESDELQSKMEAFQAVMDGMDDSQEAYPFVHRSLLLINEELCLKHDRMIKFHSNCNNDFVTKLNEYHAEQLENGFVEPEKLKELGLMRNLSNLSKDEIAGYMELMHPQAYHQMKAEMNMYPEDATYATLELANMLHDIMHNGIKPNLDMKKRFEALANDIERQSGVTLNGSPENRPERTLNNDGPTC